MTTKQWYIRIIALILVCSALLPHNISATAPEATQPCASYYLHLYTAYMHAPGNSKVQVWFEVFATRDFDKVGVTQIVLQESTDQINWATVHTFNYTDYESMTSSDAATHINHVEYEDGIAGRYYRARVTVSAWNSDGGDSRLVVTDPVLCT